MNNIFGQRHNFRLIQVITTSVSIQWRLLLRNCFANNDIQVANDNYFTPKWRLLQQIGVTKNLRYFKSQLPHTTGLEPTPKSPIRLNYNYVIQGWLTVFLFLVSLFTLLSIHRDNNSFTYSTSFINFIATLILYCSDP